MDKIKSHTKIGLIIAAVYYVFTYIMFPILTERGINAEGVPTLIDRIPVFFIIWASITSYLFVLYMVELREMTRYLTLFLLSVLGIILPIMRIWQLKYDFNSDKNVAEIGYVDYDAPPWIVEGAKPIVNPLLLIPGYHASYYEGVEGYAPFRTAGIVLIMLSSVIAAIGALLLLIKVIRGSIQIKDDKGKLVASQGQFRLPHHFIHKKLTSFFDLIDMAQHTPHLRGMYNAFIFIFEIIIIFIIQVLISIFNLLADIIPWINQVTPPPLPKYEPFSFTATVGALFAYLGYSLLQILEIIFRIVFGITSLGLYSKKQRGVVSINKLIQRMGLFMLLGLVMVFLSLDGFHGLGAMFSQPGIYIAMFILVHMIYLAADPKQRNLLSNSKLAYAFIIPTIAILLFELYVPILVALFLSFQNIWQYPFNNYDEKIVTNNIGTENYGYIVEANLVGIVLIFTISALIVAKILNGLNTENVASRRIIGKLLTVAIWFSMLYWTITLNLAPKYAEYINTEVSIFIDPSPIPVFINTVIWTIGSVFFHMIIGTTLALLMNTEFRARGVVRSIMIIPWAVPNFITISIFSAFIFDNDSGLVNIVLKLLHLETFKWVASENIMLTSIIVNIWLGFPFIMVAVLASLQSIPEDLYEAAAIDGASSWQQFRHITLPMIKPTLYVVSLLGFLWTFNLFNVIYLMTIDKASVLAVIDYYILIVYIFAVFRGGNWSVAATLSFLLFLLVAAFSLVYTKLMGKGPYEMGDDTGADTGTDKGADDIE